MDSFEIEATYPDFKPWVNECEKHGDKLNNDKSEIRIKVGISADDFMTNIIAFHKKNNVNQAK